MAHIYVNTRSSIKITGTKTIYFDPLDIEGTPCDADMVFVTHEHYDHFSPENIIKVLKKDTQLIIPLGMTDLVMEKMIPIQSIQGILPWQTENHTGVKCQGIPAYNIDKQFHPKNNNWLGYLVELDGKTYYIMGDTDATSEAAKVKAEVVFIPIGGKYTMDAAQAAEFINENQPKLVIPIHYGDSGVGDDFKKMLRHGTEVQLFL